MTKILTNPRTTNLWMLWWSMTWYPRLTCVTMSETTPEDHLIILYEFLAGNKVHATSSSIQVQVNCSQASVKLHLSCTTCVNHCLLWCYHGKNYIATPYFRYICNLAPCPLCNLKCSLIILSMDAWLLDRDYKCLLNLSLICCWLFPPALPKTIGWPLLIYYSHIITYYSYIIFMLYCFRYWHPEKHGLDMQFIVVIV